jgi:F0F1-type ATP synthase membrane subunit c/vacuolar-type H+-ATPase subunit K
MRKTGMYVNVNIGHRKRRKKMGAFKETLINIAAVIALVATLIGAGFGIGYIGYKAYDYFAPKYRAVDNKVFKESEQYNDGMVRDLENLQMEYMKATPEQKDGLRSIILHRFAVYDENRLPGNLRAFYQDLRSGRL